MLRPFRFLWKQFNGPQVTAIFTAIFRYLQKQFNTTIDYLRHFSLMTANDAHLTLIGASLGIVRPIISIASNKYFVFTRDLDRDEDHGYADLATPTIGGVFSEITEDDSGHIITVAPASYYRRILLAYVKYSAEKNSLVFIDNMLSDVWEALNPGEPPSFRVRNYKEGDIGNRSAGDIEILLGRLGGWGGTANALIWQAIFSAVLNALFGPEQVIDINFNAQEET